MAVYRQDRACKDYTSNPIPIFSCYSSEAMRLLGTALTVKKEKDVGMRLLV